MNCSIDQEVGAHHAHNVVYYTHSYHIAMGCTLIFLWHVPLNYFIVLLLSLL
jgi:hypothetical protein